MSDSLTRSTSTMLYCIGAMNEAKQLGFVSGGPTVTPDGWKAFQDLIAAGFIPTQTELRACARHLSGAKDEETVDMLVALIGEARRRADTWPEEVL